MTARKIVTRSIREQMYNALKDQILRNEYPPNTVLQIDRLAEEFGVSSTPVRESLVRLEADGLVSLIPNKGAQITDISEQDIKSTWEMRRLLETYAARLSIQLISSSELEELERGLERLRQDPSDSMLYIDIDTRLHELFFIHLDNDVLKDSIRRVHEISNRIRYFAEQSSIMHEKVIHDVIEEHLSIINAIRSRNSDKLSKLINAHLLNGEIRTLDAHLISHSVK